MKNLQNLAAASEADLRSIGIRPGRVSAWRVNTRAKSRWGQCRELAPGCFEISIAARLLQDDVSDQAAKDTILHELLHTVRLIVYCGRSRFTCAASSAQRPVCPWQPRTVCSSSCRMVSFAA